MAPAAAIIDDFKQNHQISFGPGTTKFVIRSAFLSPLHTGPLTVLNVPKSRTRPARKALRVAPKLDMNTNLVDPRWIWQYVMSLNGVTDPCNCEVIHLGLISVKGRVWKIGEERSAMLMTSDPFFGIPYPRYTENDHYRQVKVKNIIHDIHPTKPFEIPRMAFILEDCGPSFFLINVECE